jgi:hypothetical protein
MTSSYLTGVDGRSAGFVLQDFGNVDRCAPEAVSPDVSIRHEPPLSGYSLNGAIVGRRLSLQTQ